MTYKETATANFLLIMKEVISAGVVKNKTEFAKLVGEYQQNIALMESGKRAPTIDQLATACELWGYSLNWIIMDRGPKMRDPKQEKPLDERVNDLEKKVDLLSRRLDRRK